jgi:RND family efflux transporter MFP subunit
MFQKHAVAQQDRDNAAGTYDADKAIVDSDMANVRHFEALVSFEKVYAPFDGVITARNTDIGDLINAGSNTAARTDLFHIAQPGTLRVFVNVPQEYWRGIKPGQTGADIVLAEYPGQKFPGKIVRTSESINGTTRTLLTEIDLPNPGNALLTGSYAEVHLHVPQQGTTLMLPVNALIFRSEHLQVGVVRNGKVALTDLTPGHDFGTEIEVVAGLQPNDQVVVNPPDSLVDGQQVNVVQAQLPGDSK